MSNLRYFQNRTLWAAIAIAFFLLVAFIIGNNVKSSTTTAATSYLTSTVRRSDIDSLISTTGKITPLNEVDLSFQVSGVISTVVVKSGDPIKQGQPLARLDSRDLELSATAAQAALKQAQSRLEGIKTGSAKDLAVAQANLKQAQTRLQLARTGNVAPEDTQAAQATLDQAQAKYNNLVNKPNQKDIEAAQATLRQAQAKLEQAKAGSLDNAVKQAQAALDSANQNLAKVTSSTNAAKEQARINQEQAQRALDTAKANYDKIFSQNHNPDGSPKPDVPQADFDAEKAAKNAVDDAQNNLDKAKVAYTDAQTQADAGQKEAQSKVTEAQANLDKVKAASQAQQNEVAAAQAEVDRAQAALDRSRQGSTKDELDAALAEINNAKAKLEKLNKSQVDQKEVALAQAEVDKAQSTVESLNQGPSAAELNSATAAVEEAEALNQRAQLRLTQATLLAPFDGVIGTVKLVPGQNVNAGGTVMTLLDLSGFKVETTVPEGQVSQVKVGQVARLSLDVLATAQDLRGQIVEVGTKSVSTGDASASYPVTVLLDKSLAPNNDPLALGIKPGMNSKVRLVVEHKTDVLVVSSQAVKNLGATQTVEVLSGSGQIITVPVTLGIQTDKEVEVLEPSLLVPGDQILIYPGSKPGTN